MGSSRYFRIFTCTLALFLLREAAAKPYSSCPELLKPSLRSEELTVSIYFPSLPPEHLERKADEVMLAKATAYGKLGTPEVTYEKWTAGSQGALVPEIQERLQFVYNEYHRRGIVKDSEISLLQEVDQKLDPLRTNYISFDDKKSGKPFFALRIYDGTAAPFLPASNGIASPVTSSPRLPLEMEYPRLKLPRGDKIEIGRAARDPSSLDDLHTMFAWVDSWIAQTYLVTPGRKLNRDFTIYAECVESRLDWYVKEHGFKVVAGSKIPESLPKTDLKDFQLLPEMKAGEDRFILRIPRIQFYRKNPSVYEISAPRRIEK